MKQLHRVWADVRFEALRSNVAAVRGLLPLETRLMAVVKADAYGMGATEFARELQRLGVDCFGVGDSTEALELRSAGIAGMVLILGAIVPGEVDGVVREDVSVCIHSGSRIDALVAAARRFGRRCRVHLKIDTGMGRLGVLPSRALELARRICSHRELVFEGVATHLAGVGCGRDPENDHQVERFLAVRDSMRKEGLGEPICHAAASSGLFARRDWALDMVRVGLALHGILPPETGRPEGFLQPILSLHSQIVFLKDVPAGTSLGYLRESRTLRPTRIATIPAGYNDCLPIELSRKGCALVHGVRASFSGRISMDYAMLDVGSIPDVKVGDVVTLLGRDGSEVLGLQQVAAASGRIPHEFLCGIGKRVKRVYHFQEIGRARALTSG